MKKFIIAIMAILCVFSSLAFAEGELLGLDVSSLVTTLDSYELSNNTPVAPDATIRVQLNGNFLDFSEANGAPSNPRIINNRTVVPMRKIFETFGAVVEWDEATQTVVATTKSKEIKLTINNNEASILDLATGVTTNTTLDQAPVIRDNRTMVPVRFIAEGLEKEVGWDADQRTVIIIDFDQFADAMRRNTPALKTLFDLNLEEPNSFASTSKVSGSLSYVDEEDVSNSEIITVEGTAVIKQSANEDMEVLANFTAGGNDGNIMSSLKAQGLDAIDAKIVLKDGNLYLGIKENDKYNWIDANSAVNLAQVPSVSGTLSEINSYESLMRYIREFLGDLTIDTYAQLQELTDMIGLFVNEDTIKVLENKLYIDLDLGQILANIVGESTDMPVSKLVLKIEATLDDLGVSKRIVAEDTYFELKLDSLASLENLDANVSVNTVYDSINQNVVIETPAV